MILQLPGVLVSNKADMVTLNLMLAWVKTSVFLRENMYIVHFHRYSANGIISQKAKNNRKGGHREVEING